jgi:hypothetical protein
MKLSMTLTLDGLVNAMRWQGLAMAESKPGKAARDDAFAPVGEAAARVVERAGKRVTGDGV